MLRHTLFHNHCRRRSLSTVTVTVTAKLPPPINPWPKTLTEAKLSKLIKSQKDPTVSLEIFTYASTHHNPPFSHTPSTYSSIVSKLSSHRSFTAIQSLLSHLQRSAFRLPETIFTTIIRSYGLAGQPGAALSTFRAMTLFNVTRTARSLNACLNALVRCSEYELVCSLFRECKERFGLLPDVVSCNILIKALGKRRDLVAAEVVLDEMPLMGLSPNLVSYTTLMCGFVGAGDLGGAKRVFDRVFERGWVPDVTAYTVLICGYCKVGKVGQAVRVMDDMETNGIVPNEVSYGVLIEAYCKEKKSGEARNLIVDMLERGYLPSSVLSCKVIDVLCKDGKVDDACELCRRMVKRNCLPDGVITSTLVHWLCKEGKVWEAKGLFAEFGRSGSGSLSPVTYHCLIAGMCEIGELSEAGRLWDDMLDKGYKANSFSYGALIKGFCKFGNPKEGVGVFEEMLNNGVMPEKVAYVMLMDTLQGLGLEEEVRKVSTVVENKGVDWLMDIIT